MTSYKYSPERELHSLRFCPAAETDAGLAVGECIGIKKKKIPSDHLRAGLAASASLSTISRTI